MNRAKLLVLGFAATFASSASADDARVVSRARLKVADVVHVSGDIATIDLGPSPPPGGSRIVARGEIEDHVRAAGFDPRPLKLPTSIRVVAASMRFTPEALAKAAAGPIGKALPPGITLTSVEPSNDILTRPGTIVRAATVPRFPRAKGPSQASAMLELASEDGQITRVPVAITVEISEAAAHSDIPRGGHVEVFYEHGAIKIATVGVTLGDVDIGETAQVSLVATGRVVRAKILGKDRAEIVDQK